MNYSKLFLSLLGLTACNLSFAGGLKPGALDGVIIFGAVILFGVPLLAGVITALISKEKKIGRFFIAFFSTLAFILVMAYAAIY